MANCNKLFLDFDNKINVLSSKESSLKNSCKNIRKEIRNHFAKNHSDYKPKFAYQGSSRLGTMIRTKDDTCDYDLGVYFEKEPDVAAVTLQGWVWDAVENITDTKPIHKNKCIRVIYQSDYHIDLPVYYKPNFDDDSVSPEIAIKSDGFSPSDPRAFINWYKEHENYNPQTIRIVRYLKAWCDHKSEQMPSGLAMSLLGIRNIIFNDREDIMLRDTLKQIKQSLDLQWSCIMPTTPEDDLFADVIGIKKENFMSNLTSFIEDADNALDNERNQLKASKLWKSHLGKWFPEGADEDIDAKETALLRKAVLINSGNAYTDKSGHVTNESNDIIKNQPHKFYGD